MNELLRRILALPEQGSTVAKDIDTLHYFVIGVTMLGAFVVFLLALIFIFKYRRRSEDELTPRITASTRFEVVWIGGLLSIFIVWWVIGFDRYLRVETPPDQAMEVYVTGKQWMWKFAYPDGNSSISVLTVPAGKPVKLLMTSRDVIHSFYVPSFRIKQDVLPGRYTTAWFQADNPGVYQILCTEYCGTLHSNMRGEVVVLSPADYQQWLDGDTPMPVAQRAAMTLETRDVMATAAASAATNLAPTGYPNPPSAEVVDWGREVAVREGCLNCHTVDGRRHIGPTWQGLFDADVKLQDGSTVKADPAYLTQSMMDPATKIVAGFAPVMPSYHGRLKAADAAALVEFIRSLRTPPPGPALPPLPDATPKAPDAQAAAAPAPSQPSQDAVPALTGLAKKGKEVAERSGCVACHSSDGTRLVGPSWKGVYQAQVTLQDGSTVKADEDYLTQSILDPTAQVVQGFAPVMPSYQGLITPQDLSAVLAYIKSLGGEGHGAHGAGARSPAGAE